VVDQGRRERPVLGEGTARASVVRRPHRRSPSLPLDARRTYAWSMSDERRDAPADEMSRIADDASISRTLNRSGIKTEAGETWTAQRVKAARKSLGAPAFSARQKSDSGWLTQAEAATKLEISPMSVNRLIQAGVINSEGIPGLPRVILSDDLSSEVIQAAAKQVRSHTNAPLPTDPNQKTLLF